MVGGDVMELVSDDWGGEEDEGEEDDEAAS